MTVEPFVVAENIVFFTTQWAFEIWAPQAKKILDYQSSQNTLGQDPPVRKTHKHRKQRTK